MRQTSRSERKPGTRLLTKAALLLAVALAVSALGPAPLASAATFTLISLEAVVTGTTVSASAVVKASTPTRVSRYGVCARSQAGENVDFAQYRSRTISTEGTSYENSRTFAAGTYSYFACIQVSGSWQTVGATKSFTVGGPVTPPPPPPPSAGPSMPVGNLPGWRQVFADDFTTPVPRGSFTESSYSSRWFCYDGFYDTSGRGYYDPAAVLSVRDGALDWYVHTANGRHNVSAPIPIVPTTGWGQTYGRYSFRFRSDLLPGYKIAFLLWPDSDNWGEGEIDFPEVGSLERGHRINAFLHEPGNTSTYTPGPTRHFGSNVDAAGSGWHIATIDWAPDRLTFLLDDVPLGTLRSGIPRTSFHLVLQVETNIGGPAPASSVTGHVQVDWLTMYSYEP